jgi:hypothetical protein
MVTTRGVVTAVIVLSAVFLSACGNGTPTLPSQVLTPVPSSEPAPAPNFSPFVGVWNVALRLRDVAGTGCVAQSMRSQIGAPSAYSLSITENGSVTLRSASGDLACTFTPYVEGTSFTTYGHPGYYTCSQEKMHVGCGDGTTRSLVSFGQGISGRVTGDEISGRWSASWLDESDWHRGIDVNAEFTGSRQ